MAKNIEAKLFRKTEVARDTWSFEFDAPGERFEFLPGQFITLSLPDQNGLDADESSRTFSLASSPGESHVMVATRLTGSPFKKALAALERGTAASMDGPSGRFVFDAPGTLPVVFLAGGIGITPFRSMIKFAMERKLPHRILLVYSNRTPEDAAFLDEMKHCADTRENFRLLATMTQPEKSSANWNGQTGHIDADFLRKNVRYLPEAICYVAGPPRFVGAMKQSLQDAGVPKELVQAEEFTGY